MKSNLDKGKPLIIMPVSVNGGSINPVHHQIEVYAFNVSAIPQYESVVKAELRLDRSGQDIISLTTGGISNKQPWTVISAVYRVETNDDKQEKVSNCDVIMKYQSDGRRLFIQLCILQGSNSCT